MGRKRNLNLKEAGQSSFTLQVKKHLQKQGKNWEWIIEELNISRPTVRNWLNGHKVPSVDNVLRIAFLLDLDSQQTKVLLKTVPFSISGNKHIIFMFPEIFKRSGLDRELVTWEKYGLADSTVRNLLAGTNPQKGTFEKVVRFCKAHNLIKDKFDLIEFSASPERFIEK